MTLTEANNVGIGTSSPNSLAHIYGGSSGRTWTPDGSDKLALENSDSVSFDIRTPSSNQGAILFSDADARARGVIAYSHASDIMYFNTASAERLRISSSGWVNPKSNVALTNAPDTQGLHFGWNYSNGSGESLIVFNKGAGTTGGLTFVDNSTGGTHDEVMRLEGGNLLVGKTSTSLADVGHNFSPSGFSFHTRDGGEVAYFNRKTSNGGIVNFYKDAASVGSIGSEGGDSLFIQSGTTSGSGFRFHPTNGAIDPLRNGSAADNSISLGRSGARFQNLHLANVMYSGSARIATTTANSGGKIQVKTFSGGLFQVFQNSSGSTIGYIGNVSNSQTQYAQTSDERLKENITDSADAGSRIDAIQVRQFDWKADGIHQDYGMVAQELQTVAPEAVFEPEDANDMMGVDYSKLVPMLVKEIQSLRARVAQLETEEEA